jgi:hypothetical protein
MSDIRNGGLNTNHVSLTKQTAWAALLVPTKARSESVTLAISGQPLGFGGVA